MPRYNTVFRILLILAVIPFALAAPVLVQEKREACIDKVRIPRDVMTVLGKRVVGNDLHMLWFGPWRLGNLWGEPEHEDDEPLLDFPDQAGVHMPGMHAHAPQPNPAEVRIPEVQAPQPNLAEVPVPEVQAPPPPNLPYGLVPEGWVPPPNIPLPGVGVYAPPLNLAGAHVPEVDVLPWPEWDPAESDSESMEFDDDAPPRSPESTTETEYWTPPSSPRTQSSTKPYSNSDH